MQLTKYQRVIVGLDETGKQIESIIDIYDVLTCFEVTNPATQHAIKKLLCPGTRGYKNKLQDLQEALGSLERAIELES